MNAVTFLSRLSYRVIEGNCITCGDSTNRDLDLCIGCEKDLPWLGHHCWNCCLPIPAGDDLCGECIKEPPPFTLTICPFRYAFPVDLLIQRFKNSRHLASGKVLATLLARQIEHFVFDQSVPTILVPTPLHPSRLRSRGFNQSEQIALTLATSLQHPVDRHCLVRTRPTQDQKLLGMRERRSNVKGAFECNQNLTGVRVMLIDDVVTTNATVSEMTKSLNAAGASEVIVLALARTPPAAQTGL